MSKNKNVKFPNILYIIFVDKSVYFIVKMKIVIQNIERLLILKKNATITKITIYFYPSLWVILWASVFFTENPSIF
jgi:hypothetical protein